MHISYIIYLRSTPHPVTVTTRIITFLVGNPYKPSFATVTGWGVDPTYIIYCIKYFFWFWWNYHQVSFIQILLEAEPKPIFFLNVHLETGSCCCYHCQRQVYLRAIVHYFPLVGVFDAHAPGTPDHDCWPCHPAGQRGSLRWPLFRVVFGHHGGSTDLAFLYLHHVTAYSRLRSCYSVATLFFYWG